MPSASIAIIVSVDFVVVVEVLSRLPVLFLLWNKKNTDEEQIIFLYRINFFLMIHLILSN